MGPSPRNPLCVHAEDPRGDAASALVRALTQDLAGRYADLGDDGSGGFTPEDAAGERGIFLVARFDGAAVGCTALRPLAGDTTMAEIKRMYVAPAARRRGVGMALLAAVEDAAHGFQYTILRLETGVRQPEAIALYERAGFRRIPAFGCYVGNPVSVCFEKTLARAQILLAPSGSGP